MTAHANSIEVFQTEIKGRTENKQAVEIWLSLPLYEAGKGNVQGLNSREVSALTGIPRTSVTGRLNAIETGGVPGAAVVVFNRPDDRGRRVKHYCRTYGNLTTQKRDAITDHAAALWAEIVPEFDQMNIEIIDRYLRKHFKPKR